MKESLQKALDALGPIPPDCCGCQTEWQIAIDAIKAALEAKDEPVAKFHVEHRTNACSEVCDEKGKVYATCDWTTEASKRAQLICDLLNTTPPQRKPLTDEEIDAILIGLMRQHKSGAVTIARAIEAAHGITGDNNG